MFVGTTEQLINALEGMPIRGGIAGQHVAFAAAGTIMQKGAAIDRLRDEITQLRAQLAAERELADRMYGALEYIDDYCLAYPELESISAVSSSAIEYVDTRRNK